MSSRPTLNELQDHGEFARRHIGPDPSELAAMLATIGVASLDELMDRAVPERIRQRYGAWAESGITGMNVATSQPAVLELLADGHRCQVVLVTLPEETPVNEVVSTAFALEEEVGVRLGPVVVNALYPDRPGLAAALEEHGADLDDGLAAAARFRLARQSQQHEQLDRLSAQLPLPQVHLPFRFTAGLTSDDVESLADTMLDQFATLDA